MRNWSKPQEVNDIDMVFGGGCSKLLPEMDEIPDEFTRHKGTKWNVIVCDWFFAGLKGHKYKMKDGVDADMAWRHLSTIMRSFEPAHEHKEAGVAYLMSLWFDEVTYTK
jgi:hypothetical protein